MNPEIEKAIEHLMELVKITTFQKCLGFSVNMDYVTNARLALIELIKKKEVKDDSL